ncbi:hypothetical protein [Phormidium sp. FACHB-1136]|jgi:hypothetical protein|uniref:hypothetical protein n=1 Tax=Phormidium sp. FACHB-1136 TaxID=2692848 RepID=UPI001686B353|nr:hypothetical protein [Phormidium sp. FACHB-1136]MBD2427588.1 hypothetical protein [Phormidium sp. FACHB-1136]
MTLDDQIADLIQNTPSHLINPDAVAAIAPTLRAIAVQLKHPQYYILQNLEQSWVMTALTNRTQPNTRKNVVYAYPTLQDAAASQATIKDPQVMALPVPVITILFQLLAMKPIDSLIFCETPGQASQGIEVRRQDLEALIQAQLAQTQANPIPTDIA